jgi:SAM-dependent methyltransferase
VWGQAAQKINLVKGNRKIHPAFGNWSLPAPETCLRAWQCLGFCYTFKVLKGLRGKVKAAWRENLRASLRRDFTDLMVARILDVGLIGVRVHESGDFHTKSYVLAWAEIARRLPAVRFWYYTKSHAALDLSPLTALPNFTVTKSEGGLDDDKIDKATDNYAVVVDEPSQAKAGEYVCPADLPGVKLTGRKEDTWCGNKCDYCLPPNGKNGHQVRVAFVMRKEGWNGPTPLAAKRLQALEVGGATGPTRHSPVPTLAWVLPRPKPDKYPGGFPRYFEKKLLTLLDNPTPVLHQFGGMGEYGLRIDLRTTHPLAERFGSGVNWRPPDVRADAHNLPFRDNVFALVISDPPYSKEDATARYGTGKLTYSQYIREAVRVCRPGGHIASYHVTVTPRPDGTVYSKRILLATRVWHRLRACCIFQKVFSPATAGRPVKLLRQDFPAVFLSDAAHAQRTRIIELQEIERC